MALAWACAIGLRGRPVLNSAGRAMGARVAGRQLGSSQRDQQPRAAGAAMMRSCSTTRAADGKEVMHSQLLRIALLLGCCARCCSAAVQQQQRPQVKGGYDCTDGCASATQTGRDRQCQSSDFRWDLVDLIHWHPGLRAAANGSLAWDEKSGGAAVCDPTHTDTNNHSAFVRTVREDFNVTILQQLQPPKLQDDLLHLFNHKPSRAAVISAACEAVLHSGFDGISVDFEGSWRSNMTFRPGLTRFIKELKAAASKLRRPKPHHALPLLVTAALAHDEDYDVAQDLPALSDSTDGLVIMTYDYLFVSKAAGPNSRARSDTPMYHSWDDPADPPSPNNNINSSIHTALSQGVPAGKITMGIAWCVARSHSHAGRVAQY
jgi:hypothetical protein